MKYKIKMLKLSFIAAICMFAHSAFAMEVAITVDDLPANGDLPHNTTRLQVAE